MLRISHLVILMCLTSMVLSAQNKIFSPFSSLGFGDINEEEYSFMQYAGQLNATFRAEDRTNFANPASYSYLKTTVFEVGIHSKYNDLQDGVSHSSGWVGNISYLSLAFPLWNPTNKALERIETDFSWGMGLSLKPFSSVGYEIESIETLPDGETFVRNYIGEGGSYLATFSNGWSYKNFSLGVNTGVVFGKAEYDRYVTLVESLESFADVFSSDISYGGFAWKAGLQYQWVLENQRKPDGSEGRPQKMINIGINGHSGWNLNGESDDIFYRQYTGILPGPSVNWRDTILSQAGLEGDIEIPATVGFGLSYTDYLKLEIGINFETSAWSKYKNELKEEENPLQDGWQLSAGIMYSPERFSTKSILRRATYTGGIYYRKDPRTFEGEEMVDFGISAGMSLPFYAKFQRSALNFGFSIGKRQFDDALKENYVRIGLGVTLTDNQWFIKRKYN